MQQKQPARHCSHISELSTTDTRLLGAHAKPRHSIRQRRLLTLSNRHPPMQTGVNAKGRPTCSKGYLQGTAATSQSYQLLTQECSGRTLSLYHQKGVA